MLTFAGQPLLFPDADLVRWIERNQDLVDLSQFSEEQPRFASARQACRSRFEQNKGLGLPVPNWPAPPPPRLNTLYWPTGATRWARGWFLANQETRDKIIDRVHQDGVNSAATLGIGDDQDGNPLGIDMYLLPPRPITKGDVSDFDLWLIPLVDERYFWQFKDAGNISVTTSTAWSDLFSTLGTQLGATIAVTAAVEGAYLNPDPTEFTRRYDNAALLLDAAALSVGRRVVRRINGDVRVESHAKAAEALEANLDRGYQLLAGGQFGDLGGELPAQVRVTFRKIKQYLIRSDGQVYVKDIVGPSGVVTLSGKTLTILSAAYADYNTSDSLQNGSALDTLAQQIADDFYGYGEEDYDFTFGGIQPWDLCGFDDAVTWSFGRPLEGDQFSAHGTADGGAVAVHGQMGIELQSQTRVQTLPPNFWAELNACSDSTKEVVEPRQLGKPAADITAGNEQDVTIWNGVAGSEAATSPAKTVKARNRGTATIPASKFCWLEGINDAQWYAGCYEQ